MRLFSRVGRRALFAVPACAVAALVAAGSASAVVTHQYDPFLNSPACPVADPTFAGSASSEVVCVATTAQSRSIKIGKLEAASDSPLRVKFAFSTNNVDPSCPEGACFAAAPGTTILEEEPIDIEWTKNLFTKLHIPWPAQAGALGKALAVTASMELVGGVQAFRIFPEPSTPQLKLPVRIHLQGRLLGRECYVGSDNQPIEVSLFPASVPSLGALEDPNGLPVITFGLKNLNYVDPIFAVPKAQGCGPALGFGSHKVHLLDGPINSLIGLPSPAGNNLLTLNEGESTAVFSQLGAGTIAAAFAAAQQP
jgi:hypothetical protein